MTNSAHFPNLTELISLQAFATWKGHREKCCLVHMQWSLTTLDPFLAPVVLGFVLFASDVQPDI